MPDPKKQLKADVKLSKFHWEVPLNSRNSMHFNPLVYTGFKKITPVDKTHVVAYFLDEAETELGLFWSDGGDGAFKVHESTSEGTASIFIGLLVAKYPALKVEKGRKRPFPAKISSHDGEPCLVVKVAQVDSVPTDSKRKPKEKS